MNATLWSVIAVLVAAVAGVAVWWWLRGRGGAVGDAAALAAAGALPGFTALEALVGDDRRAALVVGRHNRVALVTARGRRLSAREVRWQDVRALPGGLRVEGGRPVLVTGVNVLDVRRAGGTEMRREG
jgi:hypothetical protein